MPTTTGTLRFDDYTVFITSSMVALLGMPDDPDGTLGLLFDPDVKGAERVVTLITENLHDFLEHLNELTPPGRSLVGLTVWQGSLEVNPDDETTFSGTARRPTTQDYGTFADILERVDIQSQEWALEHARTCGVCAEKMGLDPSEVEDDPEGTEHFAVRFPFTPGEA